MILNIWSEDLCVHGSQIPQDAHEEIFSQTSMRGDNWL